MAHPFLIPLKDDCDCQPQPARGRFNKILFATVARFMAQTGVRTGQKHFSATHTTTSKNL